MAEVTLLLRRLNDVRNRERYVAVTAGAARLVVTLFLLLAAFFLIDWFFALSRTGRLILVIAMLGVIGYETWTYVIREAARYLDDDEIALRVEGRHDDLNGRLISTIQLARATGEYVGSAELIEALEQDTISFTRSMNFSDVISLSTLKKVGIFAVVAIVVSLGFGATQPDFVKALLKRLALAEEKYPTRTRILDVRFFPSKLKVARGEKVSVEATVDGYVPDHGTIEFWVASAPGETAKVEMAPTERSPKVFRGSIRQVMEPISFRVKVYDDTVGPYDVRVLSRPSVSSIRITYKYPEYTGLGERTSDVGDVTALAGTQIDVYATANKPVDKGSLRIRKGDDFQEVGMEVAPRTVKDAHGERTISELTGSFVVEKDGDYAIRVVDEHGLDNPAPVRYRVDALADTSPRVKITKPGKDVTVAKFANWPVRFEIKDDYGVADVRLAWRMEDEGAQITYIDLPNVGTGKEVTGERYFDLMPLNLEIDKTLLYWVEAKDRRKVPGPNIGKSRMYRFLIIDADEKRKELYGDVGENVRNIEAIIRDQTNTRDAVRDVINWVRDIIRQGQ